MDALSDPDLPFTEIVRLLEHPSEFVRGHALLGYLRHELPRFDEDQLRALLDEHAGDGGVSLGVRHMVAQLPELPQSMLERLADDDADFIAACARERLESRDGEGPE